MSDPTKTDIIAPLSKTPGIPGAIEAKERPPLVWWRRAHWYKVGLFAISLFLFILAVSMLKEGARALSPLVREHFAVSSHVNSLGFGWIFSYVVMSGSPVAAASLAFFDAGILSKVHTFTMITGSRLGASLIVLFVGFIYVLRGRDRATSLGMGLLSLNVTVSTYLLALPIGLALLNVEAINSIQFGTGSSLRSVTELIFEPIIALCLAYLPAWALFPVGFAIIMVSFSLFDKALPQMTLRESQLGRVSRFVYRPWVMFLVGAGITLLSMSVSISLSILVPLSARGFIRRENVVPYIMGANVTTFIDTLLAALLLNNSEAFTIIFVSMISIAIVSAIILVTVYRGYERSALAFVTWATASTRNLGLFMLLIIIVPLVLLLI